MGQYHAPWSHAETVPGAVALGLQNSSCIILFAMTSLRNHSPAMRPLSWLLLLAIFLKFQTAAACLVDDLCIEQGVGDPHASALPFGVAGVASDAVDADTKRSLEGPPSTGSGLSDGLAAKPACHCDCAQSSAMIHVAQPRTWATPTEGIAIGPLAPAYLCNLDRALRPPIR